MHQGSRKAEFFSTVAARDRRYNQLVREKKEGTLATVLTREQIAEYLLLKGVLGDLTVQDLVAILRDHSTIKVATILRPKVDEALELLKRKLSSKDLAPDTFRQKKQKITQLGEVFGTRPMESLSAPELEEWLDDLVGDVDLTFNNWRKILRCFWDETGVAPNPFAQIKSRNGTPAEIEVLTVAQTKTLFDFAAKDPRYRFLAARLALEAFAGLRFSSAFRLEKADLNFVDRGILLPRHKLKTKRRHFIDGLPDNLWDWLATAGDETWAVTPAEYMHSKSALFVDAGVPHPRNCFRHSFASYHVAAFKNPGLTATLLCHKNQQMLWDHYKGRATSSDGADYFKIVPPSKS